MTAGGRTHHKASASPKTTFTAKSTWLRGLGLLAVASAALGVWAGMSFARSASATAHAAYAQQCPDSQYSATRNPANPLALPSPPGPDPLGGANLFVDGPRHGAAAGAIAQLFGIDPTSFPDTY